MQYLVYGEYANLGGICDLAAFNRNIDRASAIIDIKTQSRLAEFDEIPQIVKVVCVDLVDYLFLNVNATEKVVTSKSQSAGGVSESESYAAKTEDDYSADIDRIIQPLMLVTTKNGINLLYRGAMS